MQHLLTTPSNLQGKNNPGGHEEGWKTAWTHATLGLPLPCSAAFSGEYQKEADHSDLEQRPMNNKSSPPRVRLVPGRKKAGMQTRELNKGAGRVTSREKCKAGVFQSCTLKEAEPSESWLSPTVSSDLPHSESLHATETPHLKNLQWITLRACALETWAPCQSGQLICWNSNWGHFPKTIQSVWCHKEDLWACGEEEPFSFPFYWQQSQLKTKHQPLLFPPPSGGPWNRHWRQKGEMGEGRQRKLPADLCRHFATRLFTDSTAIAAVFH